MFKKIALITAALTVLGAGAAYFTLLTSEVALIEMFPDEDPKVVIRASRIMLRRTLKSEYTHLDTDNDDVLKSIFEDIIAEIKA